ncbi:anti-sigma factor [Streptomyces sp. NPDC005820]|uniref:anti-sigma factor n=1 Tax=Streptomyces sp. NPDC005820 TaxID=3157069 RepID=UPI0033CD8992
MSIQQHDSELLGAHVLGTLDERVPPEAFLDGPPEGGDLLLQRTLRKARGERDGAERRRRAVLTAVAAVAATAVLGGGVLIGRGMGGPHTPPQADPPLPSVSVPAIPPSGTKVASGTSTSTGTGTRMTVRLTPAADWVRVNASVKGIPAGERCRLILESNDGKREIAGSWVVADAVRGADLDGSAAVRSVDVAKVLVENEQGKEYVSLNV